MKKSKSMKQKKTKRAASETTLKAKQAVQVPPAAPALTLKKYLWDRRISQSFVAAEVRCSTSTVCRKLAGKQEWSAGEVAALSGLLSMSMEGVMDLINCKAKKSKT